MALSNGRGLSCAIYTVSEHVDKPEIVAYIYQ